MRKKVLVFPAGTEIAFEIHNALKYSKFVELYGASSVSCHAEFLFKNYIEGVPFPGDPGLIDALNKIVDEYGIDLIYPAHDSACLTLTEEQDKLHCKVVTSPIETVDTCRSKTKTYEFFKGEEFIPKTFASADDVKNYPVFCKPAVGQGSEGAMKVTDRDDLEKLLAGDEQYVICEYLPGDEYTVDCFTDRNGKLRSALIRRRERIRSGIAVRSRIIPMEDSVMKIAEKINSKMVFSGAWFFQLKRNTEGEFRLLEISARIPGTMGTTRNLGINYPMLTIFDMLGYDIDIINNGQDVLLDRAFISRYQTSVKYDKVYLDFDDTLYLDDKVNITMISFVYQCFNKGIPVILLTKHAKDIYDSLDKFRISKDLFAEIIHIEKDRDKSEYITAKDAIFIDDSFAERKNIHDKLGIPVYDLDMIESLIDWRM